MNITVNQELLNKQIDILATLSKKGLNQEKFDLYDGLVNFLSALTKIKENRIIVDITLHADKVTKVLNKFNEDNLINVITIYREQIADATCDGRDNFDNFETTVETELGRVPNRDDGQIYELYKSTKIIINKAINQIATVERLSRIGSKVDAAKATEHLANLIEQIDSLL